MKKLLPVLLIILISLNTFGFNLILEYMIYSCKIHFNEYVENELQESEVVVFKMSEIGKGKFIRYDDEIKYDGHMYDIIKEERQNDDVIIYCWSDEEEDNLNRIIDEKNDERNYPTKLNYLLKNLTKVFINPGKIKAYLASHNSIYLNLQIHNYTSRYCEVPYPPPDFII